MEIASAAAETMLNFPVNLGVTCCGCADSEVVKSVRLFLFNAAEIIGLAFLFGSHDLEASRFANRFCSGTESHVLVQ